LVHLISGSLGLSVPPRDWRSRTNYIILGWILSARHHKVITKLSVSATGKREPQMAGMEELIKSTTHKVLHWTWPSARHGNLNSMRQKPQCIMLFSEGELLNWLKEGRFISDSGPFDRHPWSHCSPLPVDLQKKRNERRRYVPAWESDLL